MQSQKSEEVYISLIQHELAVLNQKVTKMGNINAFLIQMQQEKSEESKLREMDEATPFSINMNTLNSILLILWTLTGERSNMKELAHLGDALLCQVPELIQAVFARFSTVLRSRPLVKSELTILQSVCGIMGNLCSIPEGIIALTQWENILIHLNTIILYSKSFQNASQVMDLLTWCLENYSYSKEGREKILQLQVWRSLVSGMLLPFLKHDLSITEQTYLSILNTLKSIAKMTLNEQSSLAPIRQQFVDYLLSIRGIIDFNDSLINRQRNHLQELFSLLSTLSLEQTYP
ncbi:hypothetical protein WA171_002626 [Blastocystis sp. BT1]